MIRKAYLKRVEATLHEWGDEIAKLGAKADKAEKEAKWIYMEQLALLRAKQKVVLERVSKVREAGSGDWGKFKSGVEESLSDLKKALETAIEKLRRIA